MRRAPLIVNALAALALLLTAVPLALAQTSTPPRAVLQATVPNIRSTKFPDIAASNRTVHIVTNTDRQSAVYITKADTASEFSSPQVLGAAPGQPDYSPVAVDTGPDGSVHAAWINLETGRISLRSKAANAAGFGPEREVYVRGRDEFLANIDVGVASDGAVFVAWRVADKRMKVRRTTDGGASFSPVYELGDNFGQGLPAIATGPAGQVAIAYMSPVGDPYQIFVAIWNGGGFTSELVSDQRSAYANPSVAYDTSGALYVAFRGIETGGPLSGVFFGTRAGQGQWQVSRLIGPGNVVDRVALEGDPRGNLHMAWISDASGEQRIFYAFRPRGGAFGNPITAPNPGGEIFNLDLAASIGDEAYGHVVSEFFQGRVLQTRYYLFAATSQPPVSAQPRIEDDEAITEKEASVTVRFDNVQGGPTQLRWNWDKAPTNDDNDSGGWVAFANPISVPMPESILDKTPCSAEKLFVEVRKSETEPGGVLSDEIIVDTGIHANIGFGNPHARTASEFTPAQATLGDVGTGGASDGDQGYTRDPIYYLELRGNNECSGIKDVAAGRGATSVAKPFGVEKDVFANVLGYPGTMVQGTNQLLVRVSDKAGNVADFPQTIVYDQGKPVLNSTGASVLSATSSASASILTRLSFNGLSVTDNLYPGRGFWGVWVANSRTQVANPATDAGLNWVPLKAPGTGGTFEISNWSLASGLSGPLQPGTYYVYVRVLDGAGNASDGVLATTVTLNQVTYPKVMMPFLRKR